MTADEPGASPHQQESVPVDSTMLAPSGQEEHQKNIRKFAIP